MVSPGRRRWAFLAVALLIAWAGLAVWHLLAARHDLVTGRNRLAGVRRQLTVASLLEPGTSAQVAAAESDLRDAHDHLGSLVVAPLRMLPLVGRQVEAARSVAGDGADAADAATEAIGRLRRLETEPHRAGPERVDLLHDVAAVAGDAAVRLDAAADMSTTGLIGPVRALVSDADTDRADLRDALRRTEQTASTLADLLAGPRSYLLLGANNAEMRAGTGMFLSAAPLQLTAGRLELGAVRPTADLVLPEGTVPVRGDLATNWPWLDPGRDLRNAALTPDFPQVARQAAATWSQVSGGSAVSGVVAVDVDGLRALLRAVGPVEVGGVRYDADTVRGELLRRQYRRFDDRQDQRRERIGDVARAVMDRIDEGRWELAPLADALVSAARGRHLLAWSSDASTQEAFVDAGVAGELRAESLAVSLLNRGAEKLDSHLVVTGRLTHRRRPDGRTELTVRYTVANRAPVEGPRYALGPNAPGLLAGEHRAIVVVDLPAGSTGLRWSGGRQILRGTDGPSAVVAGEVQVRRGRTVTITVRAVLPASVSRLVLEPSARIPAVRWTIDGRPAGVERRRTVEFGTS